MFRLWGKFFTDNRLVKDIVIEINDNDLSRTKKVYKAIDDISIEFDLPKPIWLNANIQEFKRFDKTRFTQDSYIEPVDFDFLEIHVIEEDTY